MIINVRSWKSKSLEWQEQKNWCKRLLVSIIGILTICLSFLSCVCPPQVTDILQIFNSLCLLTESKDGSKTKGRRGAKNSATAAKVALMKLKLHAAGDKGLPQVKYSLLFV